MRVYIDKPNLLSFFSNKDNSLFDDCLRMLKSQSDLFFNFPKRCLIDDERLQSVILQLTSGTKDSPMPKFSEMPFPPRPLKSNMHNDFVNREDLTALYLVDDDKVKSVQDKGNVLVGGVGQEVDTLSKMFFEDYQYSKSFVPEKDMGNWNALESTVRPCTDIIITDRYIFSSLELIEYNLYSYLTVLGGGYQNKKTNVVIFTCSSQEIKVNGKKQYFTPNWEEIKSNLKSHIKRVSGTSPNVTIVALRRVGEHDRTIFTNYNNSYSGDSLTYYDSKWNYISTCRHYAVHSHGLRSNLTSGLYFVDDMQGVLNEMVSTKDKGIIVGDKKSNFLNFPD